jgi:SAM-dependent methyltransferase
MDPGLAYYDGPELEQIVLEGLAAEGVDADRIDPDVLSAVDEFHALGRLATLALADLAGLRAGEKVADVGAGVGGPARTLAHHFGAHVTAVDPTPRFCHLNEMLTARTGLADRVEVVCGEASAAPSHAFDLVWTQALWQSVEDKPALAAGLRDLVAPGGRLALFEVVAGPGGPVVPPVPWADSEEQSHVVTLADLRDVLRDAGFAERVVNETEAVQASMAAAAEGHPDKLPQGAVGSLGLLMPDYEDRMAGLHRNVTEQRIAVIQMVVEPA